MVGIERAKFWCFWLCNLNRRRRKEEEKTSRSDQKLLQISAIQTHEDTYSDECICQCCPFATIQWTTLLTDPEHPFCPQVKQVAVFLRGIARLVLNVASPPVNKIQFARLSLCGQIRRGGNHRFVDGSDDRLEVGS